ncbi:polymer-forming cytoskeletal protein [Microcoleus sp. B5-D4]|uniref:polymer-forming cytoskeletal protein n=1 Tax=unclassified Microcoleus TaxID=2642155 RepID=UPI002FD5D9E9
MPANYEQPTYLDKRLRYFDGQFLKDQDFIDEQKYHIDRVRKLSQSLQVSGISQGLAVTVPGSDHVTVNPGTGVDPKGRLIVLATPEEVSVVNYRNQTVSLLISYQEIEADRTQEGTEGNRRWHEKPLIQVALPGATTLSEAIVLANLNVDKDGVVKVDNSVRQYSGVYLPAAGGKGPILRSGGDGASNKAVLTGDLSVSGTLEVNSLSIGSGGINLSNASINGNLAASGSITGSSLSVGTGNITAGSATINGDLTVNGNIVGRSLSVGTGSITAGSITGSSLSLGNGNISAGNIVAGKITCQNIRTQVVATNPISTTSATFVDLADMSLTVTASGNNSLLILFKMGGVQGSGGKLNPTGLTRAKFRLLIDDVQKAFSWDEFNFTGGWSLRGISLNWIETLSSGQHTIKVQWSSDAESGGIISGCAYKDTRSLIVIEL